jgi:hypothetical protein
MVKYAKSVLNTKDEQLITDLVRSHSVSTENTLGKMVRVDHARAFNFYQKIKSHAMKYQDV